MLTGAPVHAPTAMTLKAHLTQTAGWTAALTGPFGVVASTSGSGATAAITWDGFSDGLPAVPGTYTWKLTADDTFHDVAVATGTFEVGLPFVG